VLRLSADRLRQALFPDRLGIALFPERLVIARTSGGLRRKVKQTETLEFAPSAPGSANWQPAVDALAGMLAAGALENSELTLVLSNHFVRYVLVPWSDALGGREEEEAFARHCFERAYGSESGAWALKLGRNGPDQARLACAAEQALIDALANHLSKLNGRYRSLQPYLMASFNRVRAALGALPAWLAVAEPGLVCLGLLHQAQWKSFATFKVSADWERELPGLIAREECLIDCDSACERVFVVAPDAAGAKLPQTGLRRFEILQPAPVPGLDAALAAPYRIALGA
jgi:hypothetical protein